MSELNHPKDARVIGKAHIKDNNIVMEFDSPEVAAWAAKGIFEMTYNVHTIGDGDEVNNDDYTWVEVSIVNEEDES